MPRTKKPTAPTTFTRDDLLADLRTVDGTKFSYEETPESWKYNLLVVNRHDTDGNIVGKHRVRVVIEDAAEDGTRIRPKEERDTDTIQYGFEGPYKYWESDSTGMVHVLWSAKNDGLNLDDDADSISSMVMRSRWLYAQRAEASRKAYIDGVKAALEANGLPADEKALAVYVEKNPFNHAE